ncbi:hypothetical protein LXL04_023610 [Taraxacum kok-saghyz]
MSTRLQISFPLLQLQIVWLGRVPLLNLGKRGGAKTPVNAIANQSDYGIGGNEGECKEGREIKVKNRLRKLYTNNGPQWSHVVFEHPASLQTLAMDPVKKKEIVDDLPTFSNAENRIGRAWKRGYLLYGPPGTGKSTRSPPSIIVID